MSRHQVELEVRGRKVQVVLTETDGRLDVTCDGEEASFEIQSEDADEVVLQSAQGLRRVWFHRDRDRVSVFCDGESLEIRRASAEDRLQGGTDDDDDHATLIAPMTGTVVAVACQAGDAVAEGAVVCVVEAMKMEHPLRAPFAGRVLTLSCEEGATVDMGQVLARLERDGADESTKE